VYIYIYTNIYLVVFDHAANCALRRDERRVEHVAVALLYIDRYSTDIDLYTWRFEYR